MTRTFYLEILTPDRSFFSGDVEVLTVNTPEGEMGVLGGHIPMIEAIAIGPIKIKKDDEWLEAFLSEGFMEVKQEETIVLVDTAEWPDEIDINRAKAAEERARERLQSQLSKIEYIRSQAALQRALSRLKVTRSIK